MAYTCPRCGITSHNPNDERQGYCGACHDWTRPGALVFRPPADVIASLPQPDQDELVRLTELFNETAGAIQAIFIRNNAAIRASLPEPGPPEPHHWTLRETFLFVTWPLIGMVAAVVVTLWYPAPPDVLFSLLKGLVSGSAMFLAIGQLATARRLSRLDS